MSTAEAASTASVAPDADMATDRRAAADSSNSNNIAVVPVEKITNDDDKNKQNAENGGDDAAAAAEKKKEEGPPPVPWSQLFRYADSTDKWLYFLGFICAIGGGAGMPAFSFLWGELINSIAPPPGTNITAANAGPNYDQISYLAFVMTMVGVGRFFLGMGTVVCFMIPSERMTAKIRVAYVDALLRQEMAWHDGVKPGALTASLVGDILIFRQGINDKLGMGILQLSMFCCGYGLAFALSWKLSLVSISILPLVGIVAGCFRKFATQFMSDTRKSFATAADISDEAFQSFRTLQILGLEERTMKRFEEALDLGGRAGVLKEIVGNIGQGMVFFIMFLSYALSFWFASTLRANDEISAGHVTTVFFSLLIGSFGLTSTFLTIAGLVEASGAIAKVFSVIDRKPNLVSGTRKLAELRGEITFENMDFVYPTKPDMKLFKNVNLKIEAGTRVAFSGSSGCGKSSFIALVQRLYDPTAGRVLIDGVDLKELDLEWFRGHCGVVSQEPALFMGTIEENIVFGGKYTRAQVESAARAANAHDFISALPDGYNTDIGSVGGQLSGGQRQRIAIARALIRKPVILILDEATSALDRQSEMEVQAQLDKLVLEGYDDDNDDDDEQDDSSSSNVVPENCDGIRKPSKEKKQKRKMTVLMIAHRLATIATADMIHFIENDEAVGSEILESGNYHDLIARGGHFAAMASRQSKSAEKMQQREKKMAIEAAAKSAEATAAAAALATAAAIDIAAESPESSPGLKSIAGGGDDLSPMLTANPDELSTAAKLELQKKKLAEEEEGKRLLKEQIAKEMEGADAGLVRVAKLMDGYWWIVIIGILGSTIVGTQMPFYAIVLSKAVAIMAVTPRNKVEDEVLFWILMFIAVAGVALVGNLLQIGYAVAGERLTKQVRMMAFRAMLRQDATFFDMPGRDPGGLQSILSGDCEAVHLLFGPALGPTLQLVATFTAGLAISFYYSWKIPLVLISTMPVLIFAGSLRNKMYAGFGGHMDDKNPAATAFAETMTNIKIVHSFNAGPRQVATFAKADDTNIDDGIKMAWGGGISFGFTQFAMTAIFALGLWYGGKLVADGELNFEAVMISMMAILMSGMGAGEAGGLLAKQADAAVGAKRVFAIVDRKPDVEIDVEGKENDTFASQPGHAVKYDNTCFSYPSRPKLPVLKGFTRSLEGGKSYGLVSNSGGGKSTIMQLFCRFYDPNPEKDSISVDEHHMRSINLRHWRSKMGAVLQEPSLFSGTVAENIAWGAEESDKVPQEEIERAAKLAAIHDEIVAMPDGYKTEVGFKGRMLSGGQRARVSIARALLRRPEILLMDEATAALDNATEAAVIDAIDNEIASKGMTCISVAHRLSTIKQCSEILLLDRGVVIESGSHAELLAKNGEFAKRWRLFMAATEQ